jgi:hypothetical protein
MRFSFMRRIISLTLQLTRPPKVKAWTGFRPFGKQSQVNVLKWRVCTQRISACDDVSTTSRRTEKARKQAVIMVKKLL